MIQNSLIIKKIIFIKLLLSYQLLLSCDFCSLLDYGNLNNQTSFRLDYKFRLFKGYNQTINPYTGSKIVARNGVLHKTLPGSEKAYINSTKDYEAYRLVNLGFVYNHKKNTNYMINLPYLSNTDFYGLVIPSIGAAVSEKKQYTGFGDLNIGIQKIASKEYKQWKHTIKLGFLLFLPTGKYNEEELFSGNIHMLPGRSIYATELSANYTFENSGNWGLNWVSNYYIPFKKMYLT